MDEIIAKLEENFGVKFNDHKKVLKHIFRISLLNSKRKLKKKFSEQFSQQEERINTLELEKARI